MNEITFSVVIPSCDRPYYLNEAIVSVLQQNYAAKEIIVIDNGREPVKENDLPPSSAVRLVRSLPRFGVSQARNLGAVLAGGNYIAFLDDDDTWDRNYLASVKQTIEATGAEIVLGRLRSLADGKPIVGKQADFKNRADLVKMILLRNPGAVGSNTTVAKTAFTATAGYDPFITTGQDKALVLDLLLLDRRVARAKDAWVDFRDDGLGPRQTDLRKRVQGKCRFLLNYWSVMGWYARVFNMAQLGRLWLRCLLGVRR